MKRRECNNNGVVRETAIWRNGWWGMGQTIAAGGTAVLELTREADGTMLFWTSLLGDQAPRFLARATVESIRNSELGEVRGLIVHSMDIVIVMPNGGLVTMDAEQEPGWISPAQRYLADCDFTVELSSLTPAEELMDSAETDREWARALGRETLPEPFETR